MYLNLDLLYNINDYLYPLFYYKNYNSYLSTVYSPTTKKSICFYCNEITGLGLYEKRITNYYDYITLKYKNYDNTIYYFELDCFQFTEKNTTSCNIIRGYKCNPFYLDKDKLEFLKSNTRIN